MKTYIFLMGEHPERGIKTVLVEKEEFESTDGPEDFFVSGYKITNYGEVTISGDNLHMLDNTYESN